MPIQDGRRTVEVHGVAWIPLTKQLTEWSIRPFPIRSRLPLPGRQPHHPDERATIQFRHQG